MIYLINIYAFIGIIWLIIHEFSSVETDNNERVRVFFFWPFTLIAFIIGVLDFFIKKNTKE